MIGGVVARATRKSTLSQIRYVTPVVPRAATGIVAEVYRQAEYDFGMLAPPVSLHSPAPETLAAAWMMLRESLVALGHGTRAAKEVVAAAVSLANQCPYCVEVHCAALIGLTRDPDADAIVAGRIADVADERLRDLALWALDGSGPTPPATLLPEYVGVAVTFHYLNRMVNLFLPKSPLPSHVPAAMRQRMRGVTASIMGRFARARRPAGTSLSLLPAAALPPDMVWAKENPSIAEPFARADAAIEAAGRRSVPESVRELVQSRLSSGAPPPNRREALDPASRLALLLAVASYRITPDDVAAYRQEQPDDQTCVEFASWVSLTAARHAVAKEVVR